MFRYLFRVRRVGDYRDWGQIPATSPESHFTAEEAAAHAHALARQPRVVDVQYRPLGSARSQTSPGNPAARRLHTIRRQRQNEPKHPYLFWKRTIGDFRPWRDIPPIYHQAKWFTRAEANAHATNLAKSGPNIVEIQYNVAGEEPRYSATAGTNLLNILEHKRLLHDHLLSL